MRKLSPNTCLPPVTFFLFESHQGPSHALGARKYHNGSLYPDCGLIAHPSGADLSFPMGHLKFSHAGVSSALDWKFG